MNITNKKIQCDLNNSSFKTEIKRKIDFLYVCITTLRSTCNKNYILRFFNCYPILQLNYSYILD